MGPGRRVRAWRARNALLLDALLATAITGLSLLALLLTPAQAGHRPADLVGVLLVLGMGAPLALRRRTPAVVLVVVTLLTGLFELRHYPSAPDGIQVLVATYSVGRWKPPRPGLRIWLAVLGAVAISLAVTRSDAPTWVSNGFLFTVAYLVGVNARTRRAYYDELEQTAARLQREREALDHAAVARERARVARELHDVVAHSVTVMVVSAGAARRVLAQADTAEARERAATALATVEATGREALAELRRVVGVLRDSATGPLPGEPPGPAEAPQPALTDLPALLEQVRAAGLPVTVRERGARRPLPAGVQLSAYRVVQESLTNALKHAGPGATAVVDVAWGEDELGVVVTDDGRGAAADGHPAVPGAGLGLVGLRERAALLGGRLSAGPRRGGGWQVALHVPLEPAPAGVPAPAVAVTA